MIKDFKKNIYIVKYVFKVCPKYIFFSLAYIISNCFNSLSKLIVIQKVVDLVVNKRDFIEVFKVLIIYLAIILVTVVYRTIYNSYIFGLYRTKYMNDMQNIIYSRTKTIDYSDFDNPEFYDRYSRTIRDATSRGIRVYEDLVRFVNSLMQTIAIGSFIVINDIFLIAIIIITTIITVITMNKNSKLNYDLYKNTEKYQRMYNYVNRTFYQQRFAAELKTTPISDLLIDYYNDACKSRNKEFFKTQKKVLKWNILSSFVTNVFQNGGTYIYLGYRLLVTKTILIANFTSVLSAATQFSEYFTEAASFFNRIKENALYIDDFKWHMEYKPSLELQGTVEITSEFSRLDVKDVTFSYPNTSFNSLSHFNLTINRGEKIAIVGLNGAGKTTLIKLLLKFYNPTKGVINYNGIDIKTVKEEHIRKKYSIIFQDFRVYAINVAENVLMRKYHEEDEEVVKAALKSVGLLDKVLKLPDGIKTEISNEFTPNGLELSGGEKQRLAIARVFASNADIYVLDEPTSSLDPFAERNINKLILESSVDKTIIIIAHRLSTVVDADRIILIENGQIVEEGTHQQLLSINGRYYTMFNTQASLYKQNS